LALTFGGMFCLRARRQEGWRGFCHRGAIRNVSFRISGYRAAATNLLGITNSLFIHRVIGATQKP